MDIVTSSYLPGDPRLIDQIVYELKSQGIFDQFRKECIADVDTKPAYQNLSQRVEGSVMNFLRKQKFSEDMNKNQLREQLRKNISESGFLETGVERIVDQVVNPKINTVFLPKVEDVVYRYLGLEKPNQEVKQEVKPDVDLLPNDLEAVSPESVHDHSFNSNSEKKDESIETNENSLNSSNTKTEDESPPFELLEENTKFSLHEENSVDSHLSGISGLASHESIHSTELKDDSQMDISQDISQNSLNSEGNLSIVTSEEDTKMEICEDSNLSENKEVIKENMDTEDHEELPESIIKDIKIDIDEADTKEQVSEKIPVKSEEIKTVDEIKPQDKKEGDTKKTEDKRTNENKKDSKKSHDKHKSSRSDKDKRDDKDKKKSKSENKSKDHKDSKSHSRHSSSSKDKDKDKDKKDNRNGKDKEDGPEKDKQAKKEDFEKDKQVKKEDSERSKLVKKEDKERDKSKDKSSKEKSEKDRDRSEKMTKEKVDKERTHKDKSDKDRSDKDKEKSDRDKSKSEKDKSKIDREKDKVEKDKTDKDKPEREKSSSSKHSKEKSSSSSKRDSSGKEKDKNEDKSYKEKSSSIKDKMSASSSKHKEPSNKDREHSKSSKDKDRSKSSSSSTKTNRDKEKRGSGDSKSKSSDKYKKGDKDKSSHHDKSSSSLKRDKDKKTVDDHYSLKDKKSERRSTDRDSNDGSSKMSRNGSFTESYSQSFKGSSKGSSEVFSSGSGDSSNSDKVEESLERANEVESIEPVNVEAPQAIRYIKPKFASNIHEAMKIMKIRKQLAKLERQNQLSLTHVQAAKDSQSEPSPIQNMKRLSVLLENSPLTPTCNITNDVDNGKKIELSVQCKYEKEEPHMLPDKQETENKKLESPPNIIINYPAVNEVLNKYPPNSKECVVEECPILKSQDLSMESFEALEARLAQEMSNVNYYMYGDEDDNYECSSVSISPPKKRKVSDEPKPAIKKLFFDVSSMNADGDKEIELVVNKRVTDSADKTNIITNDIHAAILFPESSDHHSYVSEQAKVPSREGSEIIHNDCNIIIENGEELVIDEVHEESVDYMQESIINDVVEDENIDSVVEIKAEGVEESVDCIQKTVIQDEVYGKCDVELETVKLDYEHLEGFVKNKDIVNDHLEGFVKNEDIVKLNDKDDFNGFNDADKDNTNVIKITKKLSEMRNVLDNLTVTNKIRVARNNDISELPNVEKAKKESPWKEDTFISNHGLSLEATLKEVTNMSSTFQDLLQKNGKKLFIKVDKLECKLSSKVLVSLQEMETTEILSNPVCKVNNIGLEKDLINIEEIKNELKGERKVEVKAEELQICNERATQKETKNCIHGDVKEEYDDGPCYYFDKSNATGEKHLKILTDMIGKLEKAVERQSLQIHNNIPSIKKRGKKRKAPSTENNNSISAHSNPERKRKHLSDTSANQNEDNLCNTNVPQNQSFSLPLSPAESEKSDEHKKEEPVTVKTKRTGRVSNTKRYSSEDLYKPRPVLSCSSTRRRSAKLEHKP